MLPFDREKETLLITLYGKAVESRRRRPMLADAKAEEIVSRIDYDFKKLKIPAKTNTMMCLRAKLFDNFTRDFLDDRRDCAVLHPGCGLDSRYERIGRPAVDWYDLDFAEVIELRRQFFTESAHYHLIASSVTDAGWLAEIPTGKENYLVIAEGLFMYLVEDEIKALLQALRKRIGRFTLIFDAYSKLTARRVRHHPSLKRTGAQVHWGIDDPAEIEQWLPGSRFIREIYFTDNPELANLGWGTRLLYKIAQLFPTARQAQRILLYEL